MVAETKKMTEKQNYIIQELQKLSIEERKEVLKYFNNSAW
jgi:hypothetical protein